MSYVRNENVGVRQSPPEVIDQDQGGPLAGTGSGAPYYAPRKVPARSRLEKVGFWIIVAASLAILLVLLGVLLPPIMGGVISGAYMGLFVAALTLMNLSRPSGWANTLLGRRVFPVLSAPESDIWRLAGVNAGLMFVFAFFYSLIASFLGGLFGGLIVFGGLIAAGIFYNRARKVIIKP